MVGPNEVNRRKADRKKKTSRIDRTNFFRQGRFLFIDSLAQIKYSTLGFVPERWCSDCTACTNTKPNWCFGFFSLKLCNFSLPQDLDTTQTIRIRLFSYHFQKIKSKWKSSWNFIARLTGTFWWLNSQLKHSRRDVALNKLYAFGDLFHTCADSHSRSSSYSQIHLLRKLIHTISRKHFGRSVMIFPTEIVAMRVLWKILVLRIHWLMWLRIFFSAYFFTNSNLKVFLCNKK